MKNFKPTLAMYKQWRSEHFDRLEFIRCNNLTKKAEDAGITRSQWLTLQCKAKEVLDNREFSSSKRSWRKGSIERVGKRL